MVDPRNDNLPGTGSDWGSQGVSSSELNVTFDYLIPHLFTLSNVAEKTAGTTTWEIVTSGIITANSGGMIRGISLRGEVRNTSSSYYGQLRVMISGSNLGAYYFDTVGCYNHYVAGGYGPQYGDRITTNSSAISVWVADTQYRIVGISTAQPLILLDTSTTVKIELNTSNNSGMGYCKNVELDVVYTRGAKED